TVTTAPPPGRCRRRPAGGTAPANTPRSRGGAGPGRTACTPRSALRRPGSWRPCRRRSRRSRRALRNAGSGERRQIAEPDEANAPLRERGANARVAQRTQLSFTLDRVARGQPLVHVAGVAGQLGHAGAELRIQQPEQSCDADLLQVRLAAPLPVEL